MKRFLFSAITILSLSVLYTATAPARTNMGAMHAQQSEDYPFLLFGEVDSKDVKRWVDDRMKAMSTEEKVGQLLMPIVYPSLQEEKVKQAEQLVRTCHIGGILFQKGTLSEQYTMTRRLQEAAGTPLLIALDGEWGLHMRLKDAPRFPRNMGLGHQKDNQLLYNYGREVARQCRLMGIHINFAPVLDVNNNPKNPVIGTRSFGDNPRRVAERGIAYAQGLEDGGVMAVAKHFPGHGNTTEDSHKTLPTVFASREELENTELFPFKEFFRAGLSGVMTAHLNVPALKAKKNTPSSLSHAICTDLLRQEMGFKGLIFTDGLAMQGVQTAGSQPISVRAILAGNDILLGPVDPVKTFSEVLAAVEDRTISKELLDEKCRKILAFKYALIICKGVSKEVPAEEVVRQVNSREAERMSEDLWRASITILKNKKQFLPLSEENRIACVNLDGAASNTFTQELGLTSKDCYSYAKGSNSTRTQELLSKLKGYDAVIVTVRHTQPDWAGTFLHRLTEQNHTAIVFFTSPYVADRIPAAMDKARAIVVAYENVKEAARMAAYKIRDRVVVSSGGGIPVVQEEEDTDPTANMMPPTELSSGLIPMPAVDRIAKEALRQGAFPGCRILAVHRDKVVYDKSFGTLDGSARGGKVSSSTIYDLASVTKVVATTPAVMLLVQDGKLKLSDRLGTLLPRFARTDLKDITVQQLLLHEAGLRPSINFYESLIDSSSLDGKLLSPRRSSGWVRVDTNMWGNPFFGFRSDLVSGQFRPDYPFRFSSNLYLSKEVKEIVLNTIASTPRNGVGRYKYSDLGFILLQQIVEKVSGKSLNVFVEERIFRPIGAGSLGYLPLDKYSVSRIAPAQNDKFLRKSIVRGTVDDEAAACLGGISGNAGVFGTAEDVARVLDMFIHEGTYKGHRIIDQKIFRQFITTHGKGNRRCLGFDKGRASMAESASGSTYGHTGFTGTCVWVDPENELIFVFLSNRTYPNRLNKTLMTASIRPRLHQAIYEALGIAEQ